MKLSLQKHYYSIKYIKNKGILKVRGYYPFELVQGLPNPCFVPYLTAVPPYKCLTWDRRLANSRTCLLLTDLNIRQLGDTQISSQVLHQLTSSFKLPIRSWSQTLLFLQSSVHIQRLHISIAERYYCNISSKKLFDLDGKVNKDMLD